MKVSDSNSLGTTNFRMRSATLKIHLLKCKISILFFKSLLWGEYSVMVSTVDCESASMDSSSIVRPKEDSIRVTWEDIKFPPINLWSAPRLSQDSPSPEEHSLMVKRRDLLTVKYDKLESDRNRQEQHPWEA